MGFIDEAKKLKEEEKQNSIQNKSNIELIDNLEKEQLGNKINKSNKVEELKKELYRRAIENIKISEWNRIQINKNNFEDKDQVIDILLYTVGKMAQDPIFYKINVCKLKDHEPIYIKEAE